MKKDVCVCEVESERLLDARTARPTTITEWRWCDLVILKQRIDSIVHYVPRVPVRRT